MKYYLDTETTGVFNGWQRDFSNHRHFPAIQSFAGALVDDEWNIVEEYHTLVQLPDHVEIHPKALEVHGITRERCNAEGVPIFQVLDKHNAMCAKARLVVGFNLDFDLGMLEISWYRAKAEGYEVPRCELPQVVDLMKYATPICGLPPTEKMKAAGRFQNKPPRLSEAIKIICKQELDGAHDALVDVKGCILLHRAIKEMQDARHRE